MATLTKTQAVDRLIHAVNNARCDDLVEIHNELFPQAPTTEVLACMHSTEVIAKVLAHIKDGLEVEEIVDLWNVVFPSRRRAHFDDADELIHYAANPDGIVRAD